MALVGVGVFEFAQQALGHLSSFFDNDFGPAFAVFFVSPLLFLLATLASLQSWKWGALAIPAGGWFTVQVLALVAGNTSVSGGRGLVWASIVIVVLVVVLEIFYIAGPLRVAAWAWTNGVSSPSAPRPVFLACFIPAAVLGVGAAVAFNLLAASQRDWAFRTFSAVSASCWWQRA